MFMSPIHKNHKPGPSGSSLITSTREAKYEGHLESKERFAIKKIFIDNRKEKE